MTCTDEVFRLQGGNDPDCLFFQKIAQQGHYTGPKTVSKQGIYVCAPDGTFLSSINSNSPDAVLKVLKNGWDEYAKLPQSKRTSFDAQRIKSKFRWENYFPADGLALAIHSRDLPGDLNPKSERPKRWNRDSAWFHSSEIANVIPKTLSDGDRFPLPDLLARRLLMMNFVDTVRGQTDPFDSGEVGSDIECVVTSVSDTRVEFSIKGETKAESTNSDYRRTPRGVVTKVSGSAAFSYADSKFETFDLVAVGYRWGRTQFNGRRRGPEFNPLGFVISLAPTDEPANVPGLIYAYDSQWLRPADSSKKTK